jgi:hypothetical protein
MRSSTLRRKPASDNAVMVGSLEPVEALAKAQIDHRDLLVG